MVTFVERLAEREQLDLDACGEFLVLVGALLELKARELFPEEQVELADLDPEEAAEELARRLEEFRRIKEAAGLAAGAAGARERPLLPARPGAARAARRAAASRRSSPRRSRAALRGLAVEPPEVSLAHMGLRFPPVVAVPGALPRRCCAGAGASTSTRRRRSSPRLEQAVAFLALLELRKAGEIRIEQAGPFAPIRSRAGAEEGPTPEPDEEGDSSWNVRSA